MIQYWIPTMNLSSLVFQIMHLQKTNLHVEQYWFAITMPSERNKSILIQNVRHIIFI